MTDAIELVLLDIGGVLVELGPSPVPIDCLPDGQQFSATDWLKSETAIRFEQGLISADGFAAALIDELNLDCDIETAIEYFTAWPRGLFPGVAELLERLRARRRVAILSNTNALHWPRFVDELALPQRVERVFASHLLGLVKPQTEIFHHVANELDLAAEQILFIDDNWQNIEGGAAAGCVARLARGPDELTQTLIDCEILEA